MEGRMTVCNMAIEAGARAGLVAVDDKTIDYVQGPSVLAQRRRLGAGGGLLAHAALRPGREVRRRGGARRLADPPQVTWAPAPEMVRVDRRTACPIPTRRRTTAQARAAIERAPGLHGPRAPSTPIADVAIDKVFIGSCTNSRIEDLREAAAVRRTGRPRARPTSSSRMVVPGSGLVKAQAEAEGLRRDFPRRGLRVARAGLLACAWP
jgi:3-isopropylmalate/(R)-2-methylmalate dehydratase large subunit